MKKVILSILILCSLCLIAGCTNDIYGLPQDQWQAMTPAQQNMAMQSYYQRQRALDRYHAEQNDIKARNAPVNNLIAGIASIIPRHKRGYHYNYVRGHTEIHETKHCTYNGRSIPCNQMPSGPSMPHMP